MPAMLPALHLSVSIPRPYEAVYGFLRDPANWPRWAVGLGHLEQQHDGRWIATQPDGSTVTVVFTAPNDLGVLDHRVIFRDGRTIELPLRAIANGDGCEVIFTLFRQPEMDDTMFERDAEMVREDLEKLAGLFARD